MLFLGDIHGNFDFIKYYIKHRKITGESIFQVGDFGAGFTSEFNFMNEMGKLNKFLRLNDCRLYVVRGNHDNPYYFKGNVKFSNLELLQDYSVTECDDRKILAVGGAISIDRLHRTEDQSYWKDEVFVLDEEKALAMRDIDIVTSHSAPMNAPPFQIPEQVPILQDFYNYGDTSLYVDVKKERDQLGKLQNLLEKNNNVQHWFYGHFHGSYTHPLNRILFQCCNINEMVYVK